MNKKIIFFTLSMIMFSCAIASKPISLLNYFSKEDGTDILNTSKDVIPINYRGHHIYIKSKIDSISGNIVFDTGADGLYLDSIYYANNPFGKFKYVYGILPGAGSSGPQKVIVITDNLKLNFGNHIDNFSFTPIIKLKPILGDYADGIIGIDAFSNQVLEINYKNEYIKLHDNIKSIDTSNFKRIRMLKNKNRFFLPVTIKIKEDIIIKDYLVLDIGSGGSVNIISETAEKYNLKNEIVDKVKYFTKYGGISGNSISYDFRANSLFIGDYKLDSVTMAYSSDESGFLSKKDLAVGIIGNEILERFDVIIDFVNNDLYLRPNSDFNNPFKFSKIGFGYVDRSVTMSSWIVTGLYENSNALNSGLQIDDKIISVNGKDIRDISYEEQKELWEELDKVLLIVLRNNKEERVEFELK